MSSLDLLVNKKLRDEVKNMKKYINEQMKETVDYRHTLLQNQTDNNNLIANNPMLMINYSILLIENNTMCNNINELGEQLFSKKKFKISDIANIEERTKYANKDNVEEFLLLLDKSIGRKLIKKIRNLKQNQNNIAKILSN
jgi:hypothetical protein